MILHCEHCSLGGTSIGPHSAIAKIDVSKLDLPLRADMFQGLYGGQVWDNCVEWRHMHCPRSNGAHLVFMINYEDTGKAIEQGGPDRILTDEGWVDLVTTECCPKCGKPESEFKTKAGFVNHCRLCKK